jgi:TnpA family transposase
LDEFWETISNRGLSTRALRQQVIAANDSEALYVIDTLCHHETDLEIREHATDTAGATEHVFGLCAVMGFEFTPRISDVLSRSLMTKGPKIDYDPASTLIKGILNPKPLVDHWDGIRHIAASIRHGTTGRDGDAQTGGLPAPK